MIDDWKQILSGFRHEDVRDLAACGDYTEVEFHSGPHAGKVVRYMGDLGWLIYREVRAFQIGVSHGLMGRAEQAHELLAMFAGSANRAATLAYATTGTLSGAATGRLTGTPQPSGGVRMPEPDLVIG